MKKSVFIGIDVSKSTFDAAVLLPATSEHLPHQQFSNEVRGFHQLITWIKSYCPLSNCLICLEDTGNYSYGLCWFLSAKNVELSVESAYRIKHSMGIQRGKSDPADAQLIARFAYRFADELKRYTASDKALMELKLLNTHRNRLLKQKNRLSIAIAETKQLKSYMDISFILSSLHQQLKAVKEQIKKCNHQIDEVIRRHEQLSRQFKLLCSVPGVGRVIATHIMAYTYGFTKFKNWRKFACYVGTAPFPFQSGTSVKKRTQISSFANRKLKALLSIGAVNTLRTENEYHTYYRRRKKEGKHHMVIINAIRNKLISRMFAVIHRDTPYVALQGR